MKLKRITAYILDILFVYFIAAALFMLPIFKNDYKNYMDTTTEYLEYIATLGSGEADRDIELDYVYSISKSSQPLSIITCGLLFLYFGVFAYILKGQTLGKKIMKLKVVPDKGKTLDVNLFMIRAIILTNLLPKIASIIVLTKLSPSNWLIAENIISEISNIITFLILGFMIFRDDERGLHDLICKTKVVESNKEK